jgi:hypothetical protein
MVLELYKKYVLTRYQQFPSIMQERTLGNQELGEAQFLQQGLGNFYLSL